MKPLLVSSGEPAGIGPDICLSLTSCELPLVVLADKKILVERAKLLNQKVIFVDYQKDQPVIPTPDHLTVLSIPSVTEVIPGKLNPSNAAYVINMLHLATDKCLNGEFSALITAPVHKAVINQAGVDFSGHTEFLAADCQVNKPVMMLACDSMKVALVTTHLPLKRVAESINEALICEVIEALHHALENNFGLVDPTIYVAGLNPHAGEKGYLGHEEIEIISPAINRLKSKKMNVHGPFPADTLFTPYYLKQADAFVAMYHDQGLPVLKYASFGTAVNITLGLPIIRTSVDHGTAEHLAGTGLADPSSLFAAIKMAKQMVERKRT